MSLLAQLLDADTGHPRAATPATSATATGNDTPKPENCSESSNCSNGAAPEREPESRRLPVANVAKAANRDAAEDSDSQDSQDSQDTGAQIYARLLALADDAALVVGLSEADLLNVADEPDDNLRLYLRLLQDSADMDAGLVPQGWTAEACCEHCGPVWLSPGLAGGLPLRDGWRLAWGCPWCRITGFVPRPSIESVTCTHWKPDTVNPAAGTGRCECGYHYPHERHRCERFAPITRAAP